MSLFDLEPELAARLDRLLPTDQRAGDWDDVLRRVEPRRLRSHSRAFKVVVALAVFLVLATAATATYLALRGSPAVRPRSGALTFLAPAGVVELVSPGKTRVVWRCPGKRGTFCGDLTSVDWSRDGRRLAFTLDEIGGTSSYVGLHILDLRTGRELRLPRWNLALPINKQPARLFTTMTTALGCLFPTAVSFAPSGRTLAFGCVNSSNHSEMEIHTIRSDGTGGRHLITGIWNVGWPAWSPDGKWIAFAGWGRAPHAGNSVYMIHPDGTGRRLVARGGLHPSWSPDGKLIAYQTSSGIKLVTQNGIDATPAALAAMPPGVPSWSPDGRELAVATRRGVFLVQADGRHRKLVAVGQGTGRLSGPVRPAWFPGSTKRQTQEATTCSEC